VQIEGPQPLVAIRALASLRVREWANVHSADGWEKILLPVIHPSQARRQTVVVRADAAFALPALYEAGREVRHPKTCGRLIRHARCYMLQLAESRLTRRLFGQIFWRIE
jgi:hypothetical protein